MADKDKKIDEELEEETIAKDIVVTKYKMAAEIVNAALKLVIEKCQLNAKVQELCLVGDNYLSDETAKVYKKEKEMKKGIAFPTCISINNCVCHFSPLNSEPDVLLNEGDLVKIDLGAHIDGYIAVVAHTIIVAATAEKKATGRQADAVMAAYLASQLALRVVKPGAENFQVTDHIQNVAHEFKCKPIEGMVSHQLQRHTIDGPKTIIQNPSEAIKKDYEKCQFAVHEVYAIDVLISSGEGKGKESDTKTTVYKRSKSNEVYNLKMKASRQFFSEVSKKFGLMPFTLRAFEDEKKAKMGVVECVKHQLIEPFSVLHDKENEFVAQFKFTVLLMPNGPMQITGLPFDEGTIMSQHSLQDELIKKILAESASRKAAKKKKKKAEKAVMEGVDEGGAMDGVVEGGDGGAVEKMV